MNYLVVADNCVLDVPTGAARVAWDHAKAVQNLGHSVTMLCFRPPYANGKAGASMEEGIRILRMDPPASRAFDPWRSQKTIKKVRQTVLGEAGDTKWDMVHMHSTLPAWGTIQALGASPRYFYTVHSPAVLELKIEWQTQGLPGRMKLLLGLPQIRRFEKKVLLRCSGIHALSEYVKSGIETFHGLGDRVVVFPHWRRRELKRSVEKTDARKALGWPGDLPILFTVRRHVHRMGLEVAIEALAPLVLSGRCRVVMGGDGPLRTSLIQAVRRTGCQEKDFMLPGHLTERELLLAYQAADLFVLPTLALEGFGIISVEAMSMGCPVLGTVAGATPELLAPITPDLLVPPGDVPALRRKVEDFLGGKLTIPSREDIVAYAERRYGYENVVPRLASFLEVPVQIETNRMNAGSVAASPPP